MLDIDLMDFSPSLGNGLMMTMFNLAPLGTEYGNESGPEEDSWKLNRIPDRQLFGMTEMNSPTTRYNSGKGCMLKRSLLGRVACSRDLYLHIHSNLSR